MSHDGTCFRKNEEFVKKNKKKYIIFKLSLTLLILNSINIFALKSKFQMFKKQDMNYLW